MNRLSEVLESIFGCHHGQISRVFTIGGRSYKICCGCGRKFNYSLASMSIERTAQSGTRKGFSLRGLLLPVSTRLRANRLDGTAVDAPVR
jgi:hypothetical protein